MRLDEQELDRQLAALGLPDDLPEVALTDEPAPSPEAVARIKARALALATARPALPATPAAGNDPQPRHLRRSNRPRSPWKRLLVSAAAAVALVALGATAAVGPGRVWAMLRSYVPGFGAREPGEIKLAAAGPVRLDRAGRWVAVQGLVADRRGVTVHLAGSGVPMPYEAVTVTDEQGRSLGKAGGSYSYGGGWEQVDGWYWFQNAQLPAGTASVTVTVAGDPDWRLTVPLIPGGELTPLDQFGPTATAAGYTVAARVESRGDRTDVTLLAQGGEPGSRISGNNGAVTLTGPGLTAEAKPIPGSAGELRQLQAAALPPDINSVTVTVPAFNVTELGQATIKLTVADGPVDRTVATGRWTVRFLRTEHQGANLRVYVAPEDVGSGYLSHWTWLETGKQPVGWNAKISETTGRLEWFEFPVEPGARSVTLTLKDPQVVIQGPWTIQVPVSRPQ